MRRLCLVLFLLISWSTSIRAQNTELKSLLQKQRLIIIMFDGFGHSYFENAPMPFLHSIIKKGFYKEVQSLMPTVTNLNNTAICTGTFASENGITGNSFFDSTEHEAYMESQDLVLSPTIFEQLQKAGIKSALFASKKKSIGLLAAGTTIAVSPETADSSWIATLGKPASIYSAEINGWTMKAALSVLKTRPDIRCLYIHTTDYPMHTWAPEDSHSINHLRLMDSCIQALVQAAPDAMLLITADHDVNHKSRCIDIQKALKEKGIDIKIAISAERDKYLAHHRGFGGTSYVYFKGSLQAAAVAKALQQMQGVEAVLTRKVAAKMFHLMPSRIGDLVVLGDSTTVFGDLENSSLEELPITYRSHGSTHERRVPLIIYNAPWLPPAADFRYNKDLLSWLLRSP